MGSEWWRQKAGEWSGNKLLSHGEIKVGSSRIRDARSGTGKKTKQNKISTAMATTTSLKEWRPWGSEETDCLQFQMSCQMFPNANSLRPPWLYINLTLLLQMWFYWLSLWFIPQRPADQLLLQGPLQTKGSGREGGTAVEVVWKV